jgi:hypothetical protein
MRRLRFGLLTAGVLATVGCGNPFAALKTTTPTETSEKVDDRNTHYRPGQGTLRNVLRSGQRGAAKVDFTQLQVYIFDHELNNNRMPTIDETKQILQAEAPNLRKKVDDGVIVLTGTTDRKGLWAYEIDADKAGGIVLMNNAVADATADDVKDWLGKK